MQQKGGNVGMSKRLRVPTREEKELIKKNKLVWNNWLVKENDNISLAIVNKESGKVRVIFK